MNAVNDVHRVSPKRRAWLASLPAPHQLKFIKRTDADRRACANCGTLDVAVTTQRWVTFYGPAKCRCCGHHSGLRASLRRLDLDWLRRTTGLKTEAEYHSAWRERLELMGRGPS